MEMRPLTSMLYLLLMMRSRMPSATALPSFVFGPVTVNTVIPVIYVILGTEDQRPFPAAGIDQFQKIIGFRFGKRPEKPFVYDQQVKPGISLFNLVLCIQAFGNRVFIQQMIIPGLFEPPVRTLRATIPENESHIFR